MLTQEHNIALGFDYEPALITDEEVAVRIAQDAISLANTAIQFSQVMRTPRYTPETREDNSQHSFMLGIFALEIVARYYPGLDMGLVTQFALVHDLVELKTGDTATFKISESEMISKANDELAVLDQLCSELPSYTACLLRIYEKQDTPEARFVRHLDKLLPVAVDCLGSGSQVMHEDYATFSDEQLDAAEAALKKRFEKMFPEKTHAPIHMARDLLAAQFAIVFEPIPIQEEMFSINDFKPAIAA